MTNNHARLSTAWTQKPPKWTCTVGTTPFRCETIISNLCRDSLHTLVYINAFPGIETTIPANIIGIGTILVPHYFDVFSFNM